MKTRFAVVGGIFAMMVAVAAIRIGFAHRLADGALSTRSICRANLMAIAEVKRTWVSAQRLTTNQALLDTEIYRAFDLHPTCPEGGTYAFGSVGEPPTCSVPQHKMSLPALESYE